MKKYNIFQGNNLLQDAVKETLGYDKSIKKSWFTEDIYFETYFYLCNRFGPPLVVDPDYKKIMVWHFDVKQYGISVELNTSWVSFMVFGEYKLQDRFNKPSWIKRGREIRRKEHLLITNLEKPEERSREETKILQFVIDEFEKSHPNTENISDEKYFEKYGLQIYEAIQNYNDKIIDVNHSDYDKYEPYSNSKTRHALKTLRQFLNNLQSPIWIRDCAFNLKGRLSDEEAYDLSRFNNNIKINFNNA